MSAKPGERALLRWAILMVSVTVVAAACSDPAEPPPPGCTLNEQCPEGEVCLEATGECHQCIRDSDCDPGFECRSLECTPEAEPNPDPDPNPDDAGQPDMDIDEPEDADVGEDEDPEPEPEPDVVDDVPEEVGPTECDPECPGLQVCVPESNTCVDPRICLGDVDCTEGKVCFGFDCLTQAEVEEAGGCFTDETCEGQGDFLFCNLEGHHCIPSGRCNGDSECPGDLFCGPNGLCRQCADDDNCPGGLLCDETNEAFVCIEDDGCGGNDDCRGDRLCQGGNCIEPGCDDDDFEPNGDCSEAEAIEDGTYEGLAVCGTDCDWYAMDVDTGDGMVVRVRHEPSNGDLDLTLHAGPCTEANPGQLLQRSASLDPNEIVSVARVFSPSTFFFSVCPFITEQDGGTNNYDLDVLYVEDGFCVDDVYDENSSNDLPTRASQLTIPERPFTFPGPGLQVCPGASDWYKVQLLQDDFITVDVELNDSFGDLDLKIFEGQPIDEFDQAIALSEGRNSTESVSASASRATEFYIWVGSPDGGQNAYDMTINVTNGCTDAFEDNDTLGDAVDFSQRPPSEFNGLRLCALDDDEDWFGASVPQGDAVFVTVSYDPDLGADIDAELHRSSNDNAPETVNGNSGVLSFALVPDAGEVFWKLTSEGSENITYTMDFEIGPADNLCVDDDRGNTSFEQAFTSEFGVREYPGVICPGDNEPGSDYFSVEVPAETQLFANIQDFEADLEIEVLDTDQNVIATGTPDDFGRTAFIQINEFSEVFIRVKGQMNDSQGAYLLQIYTQPVPDGQVCADDQFEEGSFTPGEDNDNHDNRRTITPGRTFRNLLLCPTDEDFYGFFVISGQSISITIQTHEPAPNAIKAQLINPFPPFPPFYDIVESDNGTLQFNLDGIEVLDGGEWAVKVFSDGLETVWYDLRVITN